MGINPLIYMDTCVNYCQIAMGIVVKKNWSKASTRLVWRESQIGWPIKQFMYGILRLHQLC